MRIIARILKKDMGSLSIRHSQSWRVAWGWIKNLRNYSSACKGTIELDLIDGCRVVKSMQDFFSLFADLSMDVILRLFQRLGSLHHRALFCLECLPANCTGITVLGDLLCSLQVLFILTVVGGGGGGGGLNYAVHFA